MNLIKVTRYNGQKEACYIRVEHITGVAYHAPDNCTLIYDGTNGAYYVSESVEQVLAMLKMCSPCRVQNIITVSDLI